LELCAVARHVGVGHPHLQLLERHLRRAELVDHVGLEGARDEAAAAEPPLLLLLLLVVVVVVVLARGAAPLLPGRGRRECGRRRARRAGRGAPRRRGVHRPHTSACVRE
jgi:hypothetical protein